MAGRISFPMTELQKVVDQFEGAKLAPTMDCLFVASNYPNGVIVDKNGLTEVQANKQGLAWWPDHTKIDASKLTPKLTIVGDHGVYITANVDRPIATDENGKPVPAIVAYGLGCNPNVDEDFYFKKEQVFGADDGSVSNDLEWFERTKKAGKKNMTIQFNARSIRLIE